MTIEIRRLTAAEADHQLDALAETLAACVTGGAGVGFMLPFSQDEAKAWWTRQRADIAAGDRIVFGAMTPGGRLIGTVSLLVATPPNQRHRADVSKMLVHPDGRRQGIGEALLAALEVEARRMGKTLLTLDTVSDSAAERLYKRIGWQSAGRIPNYALSPSATSDSATFMWKAI